MSDLSALPALLQAQDWRGAERLLRRAAKAKSAPAEVFYNLAKVLEAGGKPEQMAIWLERAVAARPDYGIAWFELGRAKLAAGKLRAARTAFAKAADLLPGDADALRNLGRVALRLGDWAAAQRCWGALPDDAEARLALYRIGVETGADSYDELMGLLGQRALRAATFKAMTRTAKGRIPLTLPPAS